MVPKKQGKSYGSPLKPMMEHNVINCRDKEKIFGLLNGGMYLVES
jgi:hypothetical protein